MPTLEEVLAHHGIKGMKWGVRRGRNVSANHPPSEDAAKAGAAKTKAKTSGTHSLSNKELQDIVTRMNLEQQYSRLNPKNNPVKKGEAFVKEGLAVFGTVSALHAAAKSPLAKAIKTELSKPSTTKNAKKAAKFLSDAQLNKAFS